MIEEIFQGVNGRTVKSLEVGDDFESFTPATFEEIQLVIRNPFENVSSSKSKLTISQIYNNSLELAMQRYLKPTQLDGYKHPETGVVIKANLGEKFD